MRKGNQLLTGVAFLALTGTVPATALAAPLCVGCTGTQGWGVDFNPATGKTVFVFPGKRQIIADPVGNTETITRRNGTVVVKQFPAGSRRGGPAMALARFFYARNP